MDNHVVVGATRAGLSRVAGELEPQGEPLMLLFMHRLLDAVDDGMPRHVCKTPHDESVAHYS